MSAPHLLRADELRVEADPVRAADAAAQLEEALRARRDAQRADRLEDAELLVQLHAVAAEAHHRRRRVELRDEPGRVVRRAARQLALLDEHDVLHARFREVVRAADAGDAAADDDGAHDADSLALRVVQRLGADLAATQSPKMSTASCVPGSACSSGTYASAMLAPTA